MGRGIVLLGVVLALAGCAEDVPTMKWSRPGATYEQFVAERAACVEQSRAQSQSFYLGGSRYGGKKDVLDSGSFLPCMRERGYAPDPNGYAAPPGDELPLSP